jgi:hypothetical protein
MELTGRHRWCATALIRRPSIKVVCTAAAGGRNSAATRAAGSSSPSRWAARMQYMVTLVLLALGSLLACMASSSPVGVNIPERRARTVEATLQQVELSAVREQDLRAVFPDLVIAHQLWRACLGDDVDPQNAEAFFSPAPVGHQLSQQPYVECKKYFNRPVTCEMTMMPTYFVEDPDKSFNVEPPLPPREAIAVVALFEQGVWTTDDEERPTASRKGWTVRGIRKAGDGYSLQVVSSDCGGCDGLFYVEPVREHRKLVGTLVGLRSRSTIPAMACLEPYPSWLGQKDE